MGGVLRLTWALDWRQGKWIAQYWPSDLVSARWSAKQSWHNWINGRHKTVTSALLLRAALKAQGIAVETHLFAHGGHGFGLRKAIGKPVELWPELFLNWAKTHGL